MFGLRGLVNALGHFFNLTFPSIRISSLLTTTFATGFFKDQPCKGYVRESNDAQIKVERVLRNKFKLNDQIENIPKVESRR